MNGACFYKRWILSIFVSKFVFMQRYLNTLVCKVMGKICLYWFMAVL